MAKFTVDFSNSAGVGDGGVSESRIYPGTGRCQTLVGTIYFAYREMLNRARAARIISAEGGSVDVKHRMSRSELVYESRRLLSRPFARVLGSARLVRLSRRLRRRAADELTGRFRFDYRPRG